MASAEDDLIARYFRPLATDAGALGLIDDAAVLAASGEDIVITTDGIVEGVHFLPDDPPDTLARKALRVNLSDLAAKGARPAGFVLTLALRDINERWLEPFAKALGEDAAAFGCPLLGGDTVSTPGPLMISVTIFGKLPAGTMVRRSGAQPGDIIAVTGTIGDAALGLTCLRDKRLLDDAETCKALVARYRTPCPRNALAEAVRTHASAAMDISDGLAGDLAKLCAASKVSATVEVRAVPLSGAVEILLDRYYGFEDAVLSGGDDYEVLCTVPENRWESFVAAAQEAGVRVSAIGRIEAGTAAPRFLDASGQPMPLKRLSYSHF